MSRSRLFGGALGEGFEPYVDKSLCSWQPDESNFLFGGSAPIIPVGYSCRFNQNTPSYMELTPAVAGNRQIWTWSGWVKRGKLGNGTFQNLFCGRVNADGDRLYYDGSTDQFVMTWRDNSDGLVTTNAVFRDPEAWMHVVAVSDTTQAVAADRFKLYINGVLITSFASASYPALNRQGAVNNTTIQRIGSNQTPGQYFDGAMARVCLIDGQALLPTSFGAFDANSVWTSLSVATIAAITRGTCGYFFDMSNSDNLGEDQGAGTNDYTLVGITSADQLTDFPDNNFAVWNPLFPDNQTISNGNLVCVTSTSTAGFALNSVGMTNGKYYCEIVPTRAGGAGNIQIGVAIGNLKAATLFAGQPSNSMWLYDDQGNKVSTATGTVAYGSAYVSGDRIGIKYNAGTGRLEFLLNGTSQGQAFIGINALATGPLFIVVGDKNAGAGGTFTATFGQRPFVNAPVGGYKPICTSALPRPVAALTATPATGSFTNGNANANGPFVYLGYTPNTAGTSTINGNTITWGTHAYPTANGFKIITASTSYNNGGGATNTYSIALLRPFGGRGNAPATAASV